MMGDNNLTQLIGYDGEDVIASEAGQRAIEDHPEFRILFDRRAHIPYPVEINGVNPVLHILLESIVENQILLEDPAETKKTMERLQDEGFSRHQAKGAIATLLIAHIYYLQNHARPFDEDQYVRQLRVIGKPFPQVSRNDHCPCGSGKKFKRCCLDFQEAFQVDKHSGKLVLGTMSYAEAEYLMTLPHDDTLVQLENRAHIAHYLEQHGDIEGARLALEENVAQIENDGGDEYNEWIGNALQDLQTLCLNHLEELASIGLETTERLLSMKQSEDAEIVGSLQLDRAEFLYKLGRVAEAEEQHAKTVQKYPDVPYFYERWIAFLESLGDVEKAEEVRKKYEQVF